MVRSMRYKSRYIVSGEHRFVYCVVQKVACTSIKMALLPLFDVDSEPYLTTNNSGRSFATVPKLYDKSPFQIYEEKICKTPRAGRLS